jgi:hypothetical protein
MTRHKKNRTNINAAIKLLGKQKIKAEIAKSAFAESLTQKGAMILARRLENYWHVRGYPAARFWAEPIGERFEKVGTYEIYRVVSNLVSGIPPRYLPDYNKSKSDPSHNALNTKH